MRRWEFTVPDGILKQCRTLYINAVDRKTAVKIFWATHPHVSRILYLREVI